MRGQLLWFLVSWILCLALPGLVRAGDLGFSGFCLEILAPPVTDVFHGQLTDLGSLRSWCGLGGSCCPLTQSPSHLSWSHQEQWRLPAPLLASS